MKNIEIERKWLIDALPEGLPLLYEAQMEQGYLSFSPTTVRIRKSVGKAGTTHMLTCKGKGTLQRAEVEFAITAEQYAALSALLAAPVAHKRFCAYKLPGGQVLECNIVDEGQPGSFLYAEVEFDTLEQARSFVPPEMLLSGREVTEEPGFSMSAYCRGKHKCDVAFD